MFLRSFVKYFVQNNKGSYFPKFFGKSVIFQQNKKKEKQRKTKKKTGLHLQVHFVITSSFNVIGLKRTIHH